MKKTVLHKAIALLGAITMLAGVAACGDGADAFDERGRCGRVGRRRPAHLGDGGLIAVVRRGQPEPDVGLCESA